jgi:hypothetical protein
MEAQQRKRAAAQRAQVQNWPKLFDSTSTTIPPFSFFLHESNPKMDAFGQRGERLQHKKKNLFQQDGGLAI